MRKFWNLVKRHCLVFLRDRTAVFFSFLAMMIIIVLMGVFLSKMNVDSILSLLEEFRRSKATAADRKNATELVYYCILAGILMTNSLTVSTSVIGIYIDDIKSHAIDCFYSAPVKRSIVSLSYIAAAMLVSMLMCLATLGVFLAFIVSRGGEMLSMTSLLKVIGGIAINVVLFSIIAYSVSIGLKSSKGWSTFSSISGTLVGFLGGVYLPMGFLPKGVASFLKFLPFLHGASILRKSCVQAAMDRTFDGCPAEITANYQEYIGITVKSGGHVLSTAAQTGIMALWLVAALAFVFAVSRRKHLNR